MAHAAPASPAVLESMYWYRVVYDEVTDLKAATMETIANHGLQTHRTWGISGIPPVEGLEDVAFQASLIGVHLHIDNSSNNSAHITATLNRRVPLLSTGTE